jgi:multiple sugar transport system substrate-binding protein
MGAAEPSAPAATVPTASGTVSFLTSGDPAELAAYQTLVAAFEAEHPTIDVQIEHLPGEADYLQRLANDFAAGTPADVILLNYRRYPSFAARGVLEPLGPHLAQSTIVKERDFVRPAIDAFRFRGELVCIPQNASSLVVYYNQDLFDAAGVAYPADDWTWDDFVATAQALTRDVDGDGTTDQYGLGTDASIIRVAPFIWQNGGGLVDPIEPTRLTIDTPQANEAIQWFVDLQTTHHVVPDRTAETSEDSETRFINGTTAMFLQSRRPTPTFREISTFDWDVAPLPTGREPANILHSDGYCLPDAGDNKEAAWSFIEYANSEPGQTAVAATGRTVPSLTAVAESPAFLDPNARPAHSQVWLDAIPNMRAVPVIAPWLEVEEFAGEELERAFYGEAPVPEAIRAMIDRTLPLFAGEEG